MCETLSVLAMLAALAVLPAARGSAPATEDDDVDVEPGAYVVILEHENERQCSASLISERMAVTTAGCARGVSGAPLWALAALLPAAPLPAPPALLAAATRRVARLVLAGDGRDPTDPALDFALVELEDQFGAAARALPIVAADAPQRPGAPDACNVAECYVQRSLPGTARRTRFLVALVAPAPPGRCAARVPHWAATQPRPLCFEGDELCERDVGAGVVCEGRLCGALSSPPGGGCADVVAVQRVSRWRRFLHCAFTPGLCGRGPCAQVCTERRLLQDDSDSPITLFSSELNVSSYNTLYISSSTARVANYGRFPPQSLSLSDAGGTGMTKNFRSEMEFEPNRADFKVSPSRTTRVGLKAGEYGDNAAEYGADEPPGPQPTATAPAPTPTTHRATRSPAPALPLRDPAHPSSASRIAATTLICKLLFFVLI